MAGEPRTPGSALTPPSPVAGSSPAPPDAWNRPDPAVDSAASCPAPSPSPNGAAAPQPPHRPGRGHAVSERRGTPLIDTLYGLSTSSPLLGPLPEHSYGPHYRAPLMDPPLHCSPPLPTCTLYTYMPVPYIPLPLPTVSPHSLSPIATYTLFPITPVLPISYSSPITAITVVPYRSLILPDLRDPL